MLPASLICVRGSGLRPGVSSAQVSANAPQQQPPRRRSSAGAALPPGTPPPAGGDWPLAGPGPSSSAAAIRRQSLDGRRASLEARPLARRSLDGAGAGGAPPAGSGRTATTFDVPAFLPNIAALAAPASAGRGRTGRPRTGGGRHHSSTAVVEEGEEEDEGGRSPSAGGPSSASSTSSGAALPPELYQLLDPTAGVALPTPAAAAAAWGALDNRELDKLVSALGRSKTTWRRALLLHEWLVGGGHAPDARLATTLIRVAAQHGAAVTALGLYDWMRAPVSEGGAALEPSVFTYTAAMRAGLAGGLLDRAAGVWADAVSAGCAPGDARLATAYLEVCGRRGDAGGALALYRTMRDAPAGSGLSPSVHTYTAAMRAAAAGGQWKAALGVWSDLEAAGVRPTGHAYAAAISACAGAGEWRTAVGLFEDMLARGVKPDVVSCTALVGALGAAGQAPAAERVVGWMLGAGVRPNARTYSALLDAFAGGRAWDRAAALLARMMGVRPGAACAGVPGTRLAALDPPLAPGLGAGAPPNAYTISAFLKAAGDAGLWQMADALFSDLEAAALGAGKKGGAGVDAAERRAPPAPPEPASLAGTPVAGSLAAAVAEHVLRDGGGGAAAPAPTTPAAGRARPTSPGAAPALVWPASGAAAADSGAGATARFPWAASPAVAAAAAAAAGRANPWDDDGGDCATGGASGPATPPARSALTAQLAALPADDLIDGAVVGAEGAAALGGGWAPTAVSAPATTTAAAAAAAPSSPTTKWSPRSALNEVVCGALMAALERAGRADACVRVLDRARALGITPNTIMHNTALAALGRVGRWREAEAMFEALPEPARDGVSHETLVAAYGLAGQADKAEAAFSALLAAGHGPPRDYAWTGLIAAHSVAGDWRAALGVRDRMAAAGVPPTVHVWNALLAACERGRQWDRAVGVQAAMAASGVAGDALTARLLAAVGRGGVSAVEDQQLAVAALSAALAAAGSLIMRAGLF